MAIYNLRYTRKTGYYVRDSLPARHNVDKVGEFIQERISEENWIGSSDLFDGVAYRKDRAVIHVPRESIVILEVFE